MRNERNADAARDALALVRLALPMCADDGGGLLDQTAYNAILQNGDPARIAGSLAGQFASLLYELEKAGGIESATRFIDELQREVEEGPPDA